MMIIAIGSAINDDAISWEILQNITPGLRSLNNNVNIKYCGDPGTQLIHLLEKQTPTIIVDAMACGEEPGSLIKADLEDLLNEQKHFSSHQLSVANILQLARNIGCLPDQLHIIGIAVDLNNPLTNQQIVNTEEQLLNSIQGLYQGSTH